jgi:DNA-binding response OmpR family regulator
VSQQLKSDPATRAIKVVVLSAKGARRGGRQGMELGADAYITKPLSTRDLVARVREMLGT